MPPTARPLATLTCLALCLARLAPGQDAEEAHVVLVSIEGLVASRLDDEGLELPNLRGLTRSGAWAESSEAVYPSTDDPSHVSIITGVPPRIHGVLGNRMLNRETGEYFYATNRPRSKAIKSETLFDAAKAKGLVTASFFWPGTRDDASIDYNIPAVLTGDGRADPAPTKDAFLQELRDNGVPIDLFFEWFNDLPLKQSADRVLTRAAAYVMRTYKPHLLAIRLPATDLYQHRYGPEHYLSKAAFTAADHNVGILRRAIEEAGLRRNTTIFVVSDHGFHAVDHSVNVFPVFEQEGLIGKVRLHGAYWAVAVELTDAFDKERDRNALRNAFERVMALDGTSRILSPEEFHILGLPLYEEDPHMLGQYLIVGDIGTRVVIEENDPSTRRTALPTPIFGHGYLPSHPLMYPALVFSGRGVKEGVRLPHVRNYDVAPTICRLLNIEMSGLTGVVLVEGLTLR